MCIHQMRLYNRPYKCKVDALVLLLCTSVGMTRSETDLVQFFIVTQVLGVSML